MEDCLEIYANQTLPTYQNAEPCFHSEKRYDTLKHSWLITQNHMQMLRTHWSLKEMGTKTKINIPPPAESRVLVENKSSYVPNVTKYND